MRHIKANKESICEMCGRPIKNGEMYYHESGYFKGEFFCRILHEICYTMKVEYCTEVEQEFLWDNVQRYVEEKYCYKCEHSGLRDEKKGRIDCPYRYIQDCNKIKSAMMG